MILNKPLRRVSSVLPAKSLHNTHVIDWVELAADERHRRRIVLTGKRGTQLLLDLPQAAALRDGDGLVLDDGSIVRVDGKREPLVEILTGAKSPPGAGQKQCAAVGVLLGGNNRALERAVHGFGECIEALRPVERDHSIARVLLDQNGVFFHAELLTDDFSDSRCDDHTLPSPIASRREAYEK